MGECHKYKCMNVPAFGELRLMPTRIVLNDTIKEEIKGTIETKRTIKTKRTIETLQTIETMETKRTKRTMQTFSHTGRNAKV